MCPPCGQSPDVSLDCCHEVNANIHCDLSSTTWAQRMCLCVTPNSDWVVAEVAVSGSNQCKGYIIARDLAKSDLKDAV